MKYSLLILIFLNVVSPRDSKNLSSTINKRFESLHVFINISKSPKNDLTFSKTKFAFLVEAYSVEH